MYSKKADKKKCVKMPNKPQKTDRCYGSKQQEETAFPVVVCFQQIFKLKPCERNYLQHKVPLTKLSSEQYKGLLLYKLQLKQSPYWPSSKI